MGFTSILALIFILNFHNSFTAAEHVDILETYIVHVDVQSGDAESWYNSNILQASTGDDERRILYKYRNVFSGFAAKLSADEVKAMQNMPGFISARPERVYSLHTTHSPNFLGLNHHSGNFWDTSSHGKGVIIGLLDSGITPDHPSFSDEGMPPPPAKWKGKCEFKSGACNNKLIGARFFNLGFGTPSDDEGHGTHTASTAAGNFVRGANIFGNANGTAVGVAPRAHVAMYKVCSPLGCMESDLIAALDAAIDDGVDVLSLSLGGQSFPFYNDNIAIGTYRATEKGIFVSCSGGNSGPLSETLSNEAPWILTVGASTIDRKLRAVVVLGNNEELEGQSAFQPGDTKSLPLYYPGGDESGSITSSFCQDGELDSSDVRGKIVICEFGGQISRVGKGKVVKEAGGAAMILVNQGPQGYTTFAEAHVLPVAHISYADAQKLRAYLNSTSRPTARILFKGTVIGDDRAPFVAAFSSRGPSQQSPVILKPDIIGPGVSILAAWPESVENKTNSKSNFNIISGTSMSCPHLSGVAALLKSAHPDWSPAAIKSAIMTTADQVNLANNPIDDHRLLPANFFADGAGHVNPSRANDPGLVYDILPSDYIPYLCGLNYTDEQVAIVVRHKVDCSRVSSIPEAQINYPSFSIKLGSVPQTYTRTVTNVGEPNSSYNVEVVAPAGVMVNVKPAKLVFSKVNQKLNYAVTFTRSSWGVETALAKGFIKWNSSKHSVKSPIAVVFG